MNLEHKIFRREDGSIESEEWCLDDKYHRSDGPAVVWYYKDGSIESEVWYLDGKRHRLDGPAEVQYYEDGSIYSEGWYLDNKQLTKEEVEDLKIKLEIEKQIESWLV
jgi:antitoxin component YwqK of YwqJK toxin-antitoxin module